MVDDMVAHAKKQGDPFLVVPYMRWSVFMLEFDISTYSHGSTSTSHTPPEWKDAFPPGLAWPLRKIVVPYMLAKRYSG